MEFASAVLVSKCNGVYTKKSSAAMYRMRKKSKALFLVPKTFQFTAGANNP
jgi:hypothetical protein